MTILDKRECFGSQGRDMLFGESSEKCVDCELFEKCHKVSVAGCLQVLTNDIELLVQNLLVTGKLKSFGDLEKLFDDSDEGIKH